MPLVTYGNMPVPNESNKDYSPQLSDVLYKHSIISSTRQSVDALLTQISGSSWTVDYYSQVIASDEELSTYDPGQSQVYQQYLLIKRYELKLQGELNKNIDPQDQTAIITGTAIMYPYMKPNVGDAFIADVGDGQAALFTVTNTQKLSMFKKACYEIEFAIRMYVTQEVFDNISSKVVKETEFVKDFMTYGQNPVIATEDKLKKDKLEDAINDSLADWLTNFYSNEYRTILVPTVSKVTYDPFITTFITELFDTNRHPLLKQIDSLNADDNEINLIIDIWEALMQREVYMLRTAFQEYTLLAPTKLTYNPLMQTAYWTGITAILNPKRHTLLTDARLGIITADSTDKYSEPGDVAYVPNAGTMPTYVFSESFYNGDTVAMSPLERMTYNYLTYKANNWKDILALFVEKDKWSLMQKFYYTPIIWVLAIAELRGI